MQARPRRPVVSGLDHGVTFGHHEQVLDIHQAGNLTVLLSLTQLKVFDWQGNFCWHKIQKKRDRILSAVTLLGELRLLAVLRRGDLTFFEPLRNRQDARIELPDRPLNMRLSEDNGSLLILCKKSVLRVDPSSLNVTTLCSLATKPALREINQRGDVFYQERNGALVVASSSGEIRQVKTAAKPYDALKVSRDGQVLLGYYTSDEGTSLDFWSCYDLRFLGTWKNTENALEPTQFGSSRFAVTLGRRVLVLSPLSPGSPQFEFQLPESPTFVREVDGAWLFAHWESRELLRFPLPQEVFFHARNPLPVFPGPLPRSLTQSDLATIYRHIDDTLLPAFQAIRQEFTERLILTVSEIRSLETEESFRHTVQDTLSRFRDSLLEQGLYSPSVDTYLSNKYFSEIDDFLSHTKSIRRERQY